MTLRPYQQRTIDILYTWFSANSTGNPCLVLPTGSGKSHIVAALCKDALQNWPDTRVLMLTHQKELIEQNAEKMLQHWPDAPLGIYSAGIGRRDLGEPITFAGIQSVRSKAERIGHVDLVIIDECFVAGTKISTPTGYKDIELVRCGDTVYNAQGVGVVLGVSAKPSQDIFRLEFSDGTITECTGNHPFFTEQGWTQARELEVGAHFFSIEGLRMLWSSISTLDQARSTNTKNYLGLSRANLEQATNMLRILCKETEKPNEQSSVSFKNESETERDQAQTYQARRERAIAAFTSVGATARPGGWMGSRVGDNNKDEKSWDRFSNLLQSGFGKSINEASHRARRSKSLQLGEESARFEKNRFFDFPRLERISRVESKGARTVFNIQVSGHPSYFANGKLVHNCHLVSHKDQGGYRDLLSQLRAVNPVLRVVGLTATPYRLGHGLITDKPALFDDLIEPVSIEELIYHGFLAPLRSKMTSAKLDVSGVKKRGGEYIDAELQRAVNTRDKNHQVVQEVIRLAGDRRSWLFFCAGVDHAQAVCDALTASGISAACVTGATPKKDRERILGAFKAGEIQALTNANVLTTGFDAPNIDLIAMLRPTLSPTLYVQMAGRGMRLKEHTDHCLVLDFAGVVETHGPITAVQPPKRTGEREGEAPVKVCDQCQEIVHTAVKVCPSCGFEFPAPAPKPLRLRDVDIMGLEGQEMSVKSWHWRQHISRTSGNSMLAVKYYGRNLTDPPVTQYLCVLHPGEAGRLALARLCYFADQCAVDKSMFQSGSTLDEIAERFNATAPPSVIKYKRDGNFHRVISWSWT